MANHKILIVGTTNDYIDLIYNKFREDVVFLTDISEKKIRVNNLSDYLEVVSNLSDAEIALADLANYLENNRVQLIGVSAFDCESLELAAIIANKYNLKYPSAESIQTARNKFYLKEKLRNFGIKTPYVKVVDSFESLAAEVKKINARVVLKPVNGTGSELVFLCNGPDECRDAYNRTICGLNDRKGSRIFNLRPESGAPVVVEEYIEGIEYSCDFISNNEGVSVIRLTEKIKSDRHPFGTVSGYKIISEIPGISDTSFKSTLRECTSALQLGEVICMIDFIVNNNKIYILELTPRPGGDCLPQLVYYSSGMDIIEANILNTAGKKICLKELNKFKKLAAFKIFADAPGILKNIETSYLRNDPDIVFFECKQTVGNVIKLPPEDYDSWYLGYVILKDSCGIDEKINQITENIKIEIGK